MYQLKLETLCCQQLKLSDKIRYQLKRITKMNYLKYYDIDVLNGEGVRCTLFVSGCIHGCKGCFQKKSWSHKAGHPYTKELEDKILSDLKDKRIKRQGLTLSGGDPFDLSNLDDVISLVERVRKESPKSDIWSWTGYTIEEILKNKKQSYLLSMLDVLVDGKFEEDLKDVTLKWRGSSNQRIHYLKDKNKNE